MAKDEGEDLAAAAGLPPGGAPPDLSGLVLTKREARARDKDGRAWDPAIHRVTRKGRPLVQMVQGKDMLQRKVRAPRAPLSRVVEAPPVPPPSGVPGSAAPPGGEPGAQAPPVAPERAAAAWLVGLLEQAGAQVAGLEGPPRPASDVAKLSPMERTIIEEDATAALAAYGVALPPGSAAVLVVVGYLWRCSRTPEARAKREAARALAAGGGPGDRENHPGGAGGESRLQVGPGGSPPGSQA